MTSSAVGERESGLTSLMHLMEDDSEEGIVKGMDTNEIQYGGSPVKVGDEEYSLFRDYEYVPPFLSRPYCSFVSLTLELH